MTNRWNADLSVLIPKKKTMNNISLTKPYVDGREVGAVSDVIHSGWLTQGHKVQEFEDAVARYVCANYGRAVSSCTAALHLALLVAGIGKGDEVVCPSYTFVATANAILHAGATPVFADVDPETFNVTADTISEAITPETVAVIPVDQAGCPCDIVEINGIAHLNRLIVIEDAAPALGSMFNRCHVGQIATMTCFSFHPRKIITTGEGGMITTQKKEYADKIAELRSHGMSISDRDRHEAKGTVSESYNVLGYNYRMTDMQAAIGIEQMRKIEYIIMRRNMLAAHYNEYLHKIDEVIPQHIPYDYQSNYQSYLVKLDKKIDRQRLISYMASQGVSCKPGIQPIHKLSYIQEYSRNINMRRLARQKQSYSYRSNHNRSRFDIRHPLPVTEELAVTTMFLPLYPQMRPEDVAQVVSCLKKGIYENSISIAT